MHLHTVERALLLDKLFATTSYRHSHDWDNGCQRGLDVSLDTDGFFGLALPLDVSLDKDNQRHR
jgi:hypothetical protein